MTEVIQEPTPDLTDAELLDRDILVLGVLYEPSIDPEAAPVALPGWHVNAAKEIAGWDAYRVSPATPRNQFAGVPTYHYSFADEAGFRELVRTGITPVVHIPVPESVTDLQALQALDAFGFSAAYEAWANDPSRTFLQKAFIQRARNWRRDDPVLQAAADGLGLSAGQLDALFRVAGGMP